MVFFHDCFLEFSLKSLTKCKSDHDAVPDPMVAMHRCPCSAVWKALAASWKHKETQVLESRKHKAAQAVAGS